MATTTTTTTTTKRTSVEEIPTPSVAVTGEARKGRTKMIVLYVLAGIAVLFILGSVMGNKSSDATLPTGSMGITANTPASVPAAAPAEAGTAPVIVNNYIVNGDALAQDAQAAKDADVAAQEAAKVAREAHTEAINAYTRSTGDHAAEKAAMDATQAVVTVAERDATDAHNAYLAILNEK
jgi:hypothetical protein